MRVNSPHDAWFRPSWDGTVQPHTLFLPNSVGSWLNHKLGRVHQAVLVQTLMVLFVLMDLWACSHSHSVYKVAMFLVINALRACFKKLNALMNKCITMSRCKLPKGMFCILVKLRRFRPNPWFVKTTTKNCIQ